MDRRCLLRHCVVYVNSTIFNSNDFTYGGFGEKRACFLKYVKNPSNLSPENSRLSPTGPASAASPAVAHVLEHGGVLEHVGQDEEPDLGAADVDVRAGRLVRHGTSR